MLKSSPQPTTAPAPDPPAATSESGARVPAGFERRWAALAVLSLSLVIIGLDNTILNVALPTLQEEFGASASRLQWMVDAYLLVFAGLLLVFGTLGDRFGRKRALQAGVSIFGLASPKTVMPACSASLRPNRSPSVPNTRRSPAKTSR